MDTNSIIAFVSLAISAIALLYTFFSNTKKYELNYQHRKEIIEWYSKTNGIIISLIHRIGKTEECRSLIEELSNCIEIGRIYFPNIIEDDFGIKNPSAYQGYRNTILEILVMIYNLFNDYNFDKYKKHANNLQRAYTSYVFDILNVREFNRRIEQNTGQRFDLDNIENYLSKDPEKAKLYSYL